MHNRTALGMPMTADQKLHASRSLTLKTALIQMEGTTLTCNVKIMSNLTITYILKYFYLIYIKLCPSLMHNFQTRNKRITVKLILLLVNTGPQSMIDFAKRTLYKQTSGRFQRCHQRAAASRGWGRQNWTGWWVCVMWHWKKHTAWHGQQRTLQECKTTSQAELQNESCY